VISNRTKIILDEVLGDIVEAEFHFDLQSAFESKQHKETLNSGAGILKDLGFNRSGLVFIYHNRFC
jgi:hypothetical protein